MIKLTLFKICKNLGEREPLKQDIPVSNMPKPFINKEQSITPGPDQGAHGNKAITLSQLQQVCLQLDLFIYIS